MNLIKQDCVWFCPDIYLEIHVNYNEQFAHLLDINCAILRTYIFLEFIMPTYRFKQPILMQCLLLISKGNTEALCVTSGNRSGGVAVLTRRARVRWTERGGGDTHMRCPLESTFRLVCPTSDRLHHFFIYFFKESPNLPRQPMRGCASG